MATWAECTAAGASGDDGDEVVLTQALRSLRRSALRCRRARLIIEDLPEPAAS
jgi:hypothetical protein